VSEHGCSWFCGLIVASYSLTIIDKHVAKGSHFVCYRLAISERARTHPFPFQVECQLLGEEGKASPPFKILGIFAT
jgi:hypothetical protein